jgi:cysteinyl-tRNA synthetase
MSKSRGNIIYPKDLFERGCAWQHIRFFFINGYYRKRLNFTFPKFTKACEKLRQLKDIVNELQEFRQTSGKSNPAVNKLIAKMRKDFELYMNNDLHVKDAFDSLFATVSRLALYRKKGRMSVSEAKQAVDVLKSIDQVLQIIF